MVNFSNKAIRFLFYFLLFTTPLFFWESTSELFEFNKMWLTFIVAILIGIFWISKMILEKKIIIKRTPLDIPIILFLISQIISTIFSIDPHISLWGYYGRWNGGLFSIISYIFLYYAFVSNLKEHPNNAQTNESSKQYKEQDLQQNSKQSGFVLNILKVSLFSGLIVSLWGLPSHFGYDPTCLLFRGHLDVSCWTTDFQPKIRIFSTLGQPDWMAAYLAILIPFALYFTFNNLKEFFNRDKRSKINYKPIINATYFIFLTLLFFIDSIYTQSRSGFVGIFIELLLLWIIVFFKNRKNKNIVKLLATGILIFGLVMFIIGTPFNQLDKFTLSGIKTHFTNSTITNSTTPAVKSAGELGGTDSGTIRLLVWKGALRAWLARPIFGYGVETFAFDYYLYRPAAHNLTSEWDFLYNKAHNEYLNYLATTGTFGFFTYLSIIVLFLILLTKQIFYKNNNEEENNYLLPAVLLSSYIGILVTNFFGFSVVIINIYFFLVPALFLGNFIKITSEEKQKQKIQPASSFQFFATVIIFLIGLYLIAILVNYWIADTNYALGQNLDNVGEYNKAYPYLENAVNARPNEPVFKDELAVNEATLALLEAQNNNLQLTSKFATDAISNSDYLVTTYPNNVVLWKDRVRVFYSLSEINKKYLPYALQAIQHASILAPTDAKVFYNLGVLYAQNGDAKNAISTLKKTIVLKKDYRDAYFALAIIYRSQALDKTGKKVVNMENEKMAVYYLKYILNNLSPNDTESIKTLQNWGEL